MKRMWMVGAAILLLAFVVDRSATAQATYIGSDACAECHEQEWNDHRVSGHPYKLHKAEDVMTWPLPLPEGFEWEDISYVIGGYGWKVRYMGTDGFIITEAPPGNPGNNQFNLATGEWVDYHASEVKPYDCGSCHTTGFDPMGNQDGLMGIEGTWVFEGIQCEECHGPGSLHIASPPANIVKDDSAAACGACHTRGDDPMIIPASGGFVRHHEQWNELNNSPHAFLDCTSCHDPHKKSEYSIHTQCTDCHDEYLDTKATFKKLGKKHIEFGLSCEDCHMPYAAKTAVAFNEYKADIRSHLFDITTDKDVNMFNEEGNEATGVLVGEYVCLGCHDNQRAKFAAKDAKAMEKGKPLPSINWARKMVKKIHKGGS